MREAAMMGKSENRAMNATDDVEIRGFGGERHGGGSQRGLAIESGSAERRAEKKMGNGFHEAIESLADCVGRTCYSDLHRHDTSLPFTDGVRFTAI